MTAAVRPSSAVATRPVDAAPAIIHAPEIAALTTAQARALLEPRLPIGVKLERVLSEVYFAIKKDPKLGECTPESLLEATAKALSTGLVIGEKVYLIPFNVKVKDAKGGERWESRAQAIRDYKGDVELVKAAGGARHIDAHVWYEKESFDYELGSQPFVKHKPLPPAKRGKPVGAYAIATTGAMVPQTIKVMYFDEIDAVRQRYSKSWKGGELATIIHWYGPKTAIKQLIKLLPSTPRLQALERELEQEIVVDAELDEPAAIAASTEKDPRIPGQVPAEHSSADLGAEPAADDDGVSATDSVDDAFNFKLPGKPGVDFNKQAGKAIGTFKTPHLVKIRDWCVKQLEKAEVEIDDPAADPTLVALIRNIDVLTVDRAAHPEHEPGYVQPPDLVAQLEQSVAATTKPAGSGGPVSMPKPGTIESAFSNPVQKINTTPAPTFGALVRQIEKLLASADRTAEEKTAIRGRMEDAASIEDLQAIVTDLSFPC